MNNQIRNIMKNTVVIVLVTTTIATGIGSWSCSPKSYSGPIESITVAWAPFEQTALLLIAENRSFFSQNGLDVNLLKYDTGAGSLNGMMNGEADITVGISEFPVVRSAFQKSKVHIIGADSKIEQQYLVVRKDRGIEKVADLKDKRIGTTLGTIAEFYLGRFLELNGISIKDITIVDLKTPAEWENALPDGVVDAIVTAQPYADLTSKHLGSNAVVWPVQSGQYIFGLIVSSDDMIAKNPEPIRRFLKSLVQAEEYAFNHPSEAKTIIQKRLSMDAAVVESIWSRDQFSVSLDQTLILAMEDEARWMISNNLTTEKMIPNFLNYIYVEALKSVKPGAVRIVGK
jgi:ABC-type nitrate/sulfonate/bicarbonate transport system substrate-binding protein